MGTPDKDIYDFECYHCGCGYDNGEGKWSKQLDCYVCEQCHDELEDQN